MRLKPAGGHILERHAKQYRPQQQKTIVVPGNFPKTSVQQPEAFMVKEEESRHFKTQALASTGGSKGKPRLWA